MVLFMADKASSAFFKASICLSSFQAVRTFLDFLFVSGEYGPIGMFRVGPIHDWSGLGHPDRPDSPSFRLTTLAPSPNVGMGSV